MTLVSICVRIRVVANEEDGWTMTRARARYVHEQQRIDNLLDLYIPNAIALDDAVRAKTQLERRRQGAASTPPKELYIGAGATRKMASSRLYGLMAEMTPCRVVDNYLCYVTDLLSLLFRSRPECLKSSETVTLDFVLDHKTTPRYRPVTDVGPRHKRPACTALGSVRTRNESDDSDH